MTRQAARSGHARRAAPAILTGGPHATLADRAAAALWQIRPPVERIDVIVPTRRRSRGGIVFHEGTVPPDERTTIDGIPVTTVGRTLLDLGAHGDVHLVERAANEAEARGLGDALPITELLERHRGHRGAATLRRVLAHVHDGVTESELEERFLRFLDEHGLSRPALNVWVEGRRCDAVWGDQRLIVELDSRIWHGTARAFDDDRERDRVLQVAGWRTVRITARHLRDGRRALAADLRALRA